MTNKTCETCRWWIALKNVRIDVMSQHRKGSDEENIGSCRRESPVIVDRSALSPWPFTEIDEWCGEWAQRKPTEGIKPATPSNPPGTS